MSLSTDIFERRNSGERKKSRKVYRAYRCSSKLRGNSLSGSKLLGLLILGLAMIHVAAYAQPATPPKASQPQKSQPPAKRTTGAQAQPKTAAKTTTSFSLSEGLQEESGRAPATETAPAASSPQYDPEITELRKLFGMGDKKIPASTDTKDITPPEVTNLTKAEIEPGEPVKFAATVLDASPTLVVNVHYRRVNVDEDYVKVPLKQIGDADRTNFEIVLPANLFGDRDIQYFIEAIDGEGNKGYSTIDINSPHLLVLKGKTRYVPWIAFIAAIILIPSIFILVTRKVNTAKEAQRTVELRKFISRQKQLEKERKRLYQRHLQKMKGHKRMDGEDDDEAMSEDDFIDYEEETLARDPVRAKKPKAGGAKGKAAPSHGSRSTPRRSTDSMTSSDSTKKVEAILKKLDNKIASSPRPEKSDFDLNGEVSKLLQNDDVFKKQPNKLKFDLDDSNGSDPEQGL